MNKRLLLTIATAIGITVAATTAVAAPLVCAKLDITGTTDPTGLVPCTNGSCFGMFLAPGLYYWIPIFPGTDGGIVIGKGQKSGGQEVNGLLSTDGELTAVWNYGANWGTFFTAPSDAGNVFDDASCTGSGCGSNTTPRKTDLAVWNTAWGGQTIPMGSAAGCNKTLLPACTADQVAGIFVKTWTIDPAAGSVPRNYRLTYNQVVPTAFPNYPFELILSGNVIAGNCIPVVTVSPSTLTGDYGVALPFTISVVNLQSLPLTCRVVTPPTNGAVALNNCASGTYTANFGFVGTDSFAIVANDTRVDGIPFTVNVAVTAPSTPSPTGTPTGTPTGPTPTHTPTGTPTNSPTPSIEPTNTPIGTPTNTPTSTPTNTPIIGGHPTPTNTPTHTPTNSPTNTPMITPSACTDMFPVSQATLTGKQGHLSITVTGNIVSVNPNGKEIKICPTTTASYTARTNTPKATVVCKVKSNTARGQGNVKVNDHIKCTDKPIGNDKLGIKIKSGVNKKPM